MASQSGKLEKEETPEQAAVRELLEETGISLARPSQVQYEGSINFGPNAESGIPVGKSAIEFFPQSFDWV